MHTDLKTIHMFGGWAMYTDLKTSHMSWGQDLAH